MVNSGVGVGGIRGNGLSPGREGGYVGEIVCTISLHEVFQLDAKRWQNEP